LAGRAIGVGRLLDGLNPWGQEKLPAKGCSLTVIFCFSGLDADAESNHSTGQKVHIQRSIGLGGELARIRVMQMMAATHLLSALRANSVADKAA
jgi:hypothetical protein